MREIILISFLGPDQPNQFTRLMQVLSTHSLQILDVGQAVIHNQLTLGIVISSDDQTATALAMKEILILAHDIGLTVRFKPITTTEYDQWVSEGGRTRYIVTALAPELEASHLQAVTNIVSILSKDYVVLVMIALLIASPLAWWMMNKWLEDFAYRTSISWTVFAITICIVVCISLLTISIQAIKAAVANPVKGLRTE